VARQHAGQAVAGYLRKYVVAPRSRREQRLSLTAADGVRLNAWRIDGPPSSPCTVVLVHGFTNWSRSPRIHAFAQRLAERVHVVVPDLRGHGHSGGVCSLGRHEPLDVEAAVQAARPGLPVVTVGVSLGGAVALIHAGAFGGVAGTVAISAPSGWAGASRVGFDRIQRWVRAPAGRAVLAALLRTRISADCEGLPDAATAVAAAAPVFTIVVHDPDDWYFGPEHAERIHDWASEPKQLWWCRGGGHGTDLLTAEFAERLVPEVIRGLNAGGAAPAATR
jgi:pimeloyl-ACP methyl ester carboxylesterase